MSKVYLSGPITGMTYESSEAWRDYAKDALKEFGIKALSPMRGQQFLKKYGVLSAFGDEFSNDGALSTPKAMTDRDRFDTINCDVLLVNLIGATRVSIGTMMEVAWADILRKPIVLAMEEQGNVHEHIMLQEMAGFRVSSIEDAVEVVKSILL